jgi:hypothetical protein
VSEKEAEAGRSRRGSRTASAAASPWHDPGLRLQRLLKEAFLGAAVSLLVRDRRQVGPRVLRVPRGEVAPLPARPAWWGRPVGAEGPLRVAPRPGFRRARPLLSESDPAPPPGAGLLLLRLTGGPAASLFSRPSPGLCASSLPSGRLRPSLYGQKPVSCGPLVGGRPFSPRQRPPLTLLPADGHRRVRRFLRRASAPS